MNNPLVAFCMPTYQREKTIQHAIRSVIDQTYTNWRLIIVDDGGTDNTKRVIDGFANSKIIYKKIEHCGFVSRVRNEANKIANELGAEIVIVQDSDDFSYPERAMEIVEAFEENPDADLVYHAMHLRFYDPFNNAMSYQLRPTLPYFKDHLLREQFIPGQFAAKLKTILDIGGYDPRIICCDDYEILLNFGLNDKKFVPIYKSLYLYSDSPDSINVNGEMNGSRRRDVEIILKWLKDEYDISAIAGLIRSTVGDSQIISREIITRK